MKYDWMERKSNGNRASGESQSGLSLQILLGPSKPGMCPHPGVGRTTSERAFCDLLSHNCSQRISLQPAGSKTVGNNIFSFVALLWRNKVTRSMVYSREKGFDSCRWSCRGRRNGSERQDDGEGSVRQTHCFRSPLEPCLLWSHDF